MIIENPFKKLQQLSKARKTKTVDVKVTKFNLGNYNTKSRDLRITYANNVLRTAVLAGGDFFKQHPLKTISRPKLTPIKKHFKATEVQLSVKKENLNESAKANCRRVVEKWCRSQNSSRRYSLLTYHEYQLEWTMFFLYKSFSDHQCLSSH